MGNFWKTLPKPFFAQAPMEDVTDAAFRRLIAKYGKPHVMFMEFTSADGLILADEKGKRTLRAKLLYDEGERPVVAQLFSAVPERMEQAAHIVAELGCDGIDINMGCPDRAVEKSGCGADLIKHPDRARALIQAAKVGGGGLPISVKTRIGYNTNELDTWLPELLAENLTNITLHLRTRKEMSLVPARWEIMQEAIALRDRYSPGTLITGNGDVVDINDAKKKAQAVGCDGVMLGRAIYGNPWLYSGRTEPPTPHEKMRALIEHIHLFEKLLGETTHYATMKKHFKAYISGWSHNEERSGAKELRQRLMMTQSASEAFDILNGELYTVRG